MSEAGLSTHTDEWRAPRGPESALACGSRAARRALFSWLALGLSVETMTRGAAAAVAAAVAAAALLLSSPLAAAAAHERDGRALLTACEAGSCSAEAEAEADSAADSTRGQVPVLDVGPLLGADDADWASSPRATVTLERLRDACERWGFFLIENHGVDAASLAEVSSATRAFFALPREVKARVRRTRSNSRGWADDELTKRLPDLKEVFDFGHVPRPHLGAEEAANRVMDGWNQWPDEAAAPGFRGAMERHYERMEALSLVLTRALAAALGLPPRALDAAFANKTHTAFLRLNTYPLLPRDESGLGISRHTDAGALTVLWQEGPPALQVYSGSKEDNADGSWVDVPVREGALTVNVGDMVHVWTGGACSAPEHRVLPSRSAVRYSAAFFFNPSYDTDVRVLEPLRRSARQAFRAVNWGEFRRRRYEGDYADVGRESQVEDWLM